MASILDDDFAPNTNPSLADWSTFIGVPHDKYYIRQWVALEETGKYSFNIGAFFFGALCSIVKEIEDKAKWRRTSCFSGWEKENCWQKSDFRTSAFIGR